MADRPMTEREHRLDPHVHLPDATGKSRGLMSAADKAKLDTVSTAQPAAAAPVGAQVVRMGPPGPRGAKGDTGEAGPVGPKGDPGEPRLPADAVATLDGLGSRPGIATTYARGDHYHGISLAHDRLTDLGDDDHPQYLLTNGTRTLAGDLVVAAGKKVDGLDLSVHNHSDLGGAPVDHGYLNGLGDDDHTQYLRADGSRQLAGSLAVAAGVTIDGVDISAHDHSTLGNGAPIDHGNLNGIGDDDHTQYYNQVRGDARYALTGHSHSGVYAPAAQGVTGGNAHDHVGGDGAALDHVNLLNKGTNTHAQLDSHLASTANPHATTKAQVGLGSVDNTSDLSKPISTATQTALDGKAPVAKGVTNGDAHDHSGGDGAQIDHGGLAGLADDDHAQYLRADGTRQLSGNLAVAAGVTIDGVDISAHNHSTLGNGGVIEHGNLNGIGDDDHTQYLLASGARGLSGNLALGAGVTVDGLDPGSHAHTGAAGQGPQIAYSSLTGRPVGKEVVTLLPSTAKLPSGGGTTLAQGSGTNIRYDYIQYSDGVSLNNDAFFTVSVPAAYTGAAIAIRYYLLLGAVTSGNIVLATHGVVAGDDDVWDAAVAAVAAGGTLAYGGTGRSAGDVAVIDANWSSALPAAGDLAIFRLRRNGADVADTVNEAVKLLAIKFEFPVTL